MTMAIGHTEKDGRAVLDVVRDRHPPFSPAAAVAEFAALLREYRVTTVSGDRYAGEWPREQFRQHGITYAPANRPKSDLYRDVRALLNSGRVELLDHPRLAAQFLGLERRTARGGRDSIDHAPGAHDDLANSVAGVLVQLAGGLRFPGRGILRILPDGSRKAETVRRRKTQLCAGQGLGRLGPAPSKTTCAPYCHASSRQHCRHSSLIDLAAFPSSPVDFVELLE